MTVALAAAGCGATSVRVALAPSIDTRRQLGFEATVSVAAGWPLDYHGQSRHYVQARTGVGGVIQQGSTGDPRPQWPHGPQWIFRADLDSLHWALPRVDLRAGAGLARRFASDGEGAGSSNGGSASWSAAGYFALLPVIHANDGGHPAVRQLCIGPELRAEALFGDDGSRGGSFSLPLVVELNLLMAGD